MNYFNGKLAEYTQIMEDGAPALKDYNDHLISKEEAVSRLESTQTKFNRIASELEVMKYPPIYKRHHELTVSANSDFSAGLTQEIIAIKTGDPEAAGNALYYFKSSLTKTEQARDEMARINNL